MYDMLNPISIQGPRFLCAPVSRAAVLYRTRHAPRSYSGDPVHREKIMEQIILQQFQRYPLMTAQDVIKLLYQQEFGAEHLMKDAAGAARRIESEIRLGQRGAENEPLYESIGEGLCRLNLRPASEKLSIQEITDLFTDCAGTSRGTKEGFRRRVNEAVRLCEQERLPVEAVDIELFMANYDYKRCPPLSHSVVYHDAYHPSYRVVKQKQLKDLLRSKRDEG